VAWHGLRGSWCSEVSLTRGGLAWPQRFVDDIRAMRAQLRRLKVGKFTQRWRQMTSTSHAVAAMLRMCGDVSLYGVNIDPRAPDASAPDVAMRFDLEGSQPPQRRKRRES
jgi:hypothetical protein